MPLSQNIQQIQQLIQETERCCHRSLGSVMLLAVSKQQSVRTVEEAATLGLTQFAENYYQEAVEKINQLSHLNLSWHFIGPIQSNKTKGIATHFDWVHSVNRLSIAERLSHYRSPEALPLNICLQVNIIKEDSKSGVTMDQTMELAGAISQLPRLKLRGLMTIPPPQDNPQTQYDILVQLNQLLHRINNQLGLAMDTLSMGMSGDLVPAIKAGSTIVRIGQALFGARIKG